MPSSEKITCSISRPDTTTLNGVPWQPDLPLTVAVPRAHSSPPAGAGPGGGVQTTWRPARPPVAVAAAAAVAAVAAAAVAAAAAVVAAVAAGRPHDRLTR